jgi:uncharacterized protein
VSVTYLTIGTGQVKLDSKFKGGTLTFSTKQVSKTITVPIIADNAIERAETITLQITGTSGPATLIDDAGTGTIMNDD